MELAAHCLFALEQHEDCVSLLQPLVQLDAEHSSPAATHTAACLRRLFVSASGSIGGGSDYADKEESVCIDNDGDVPVLGIAGIYCVLGRSYEMLDHRARALRSLCMALRLDPACVEAAEYLVDGGMLSVADRRALYEELAELRLRPWLLPFYRVLLLNSSPASIDHDQLIVVTAKGSSCSATGAAAQFSHDHGNVVNSTSNYDSSCSAAWLARRAAHCLSQRGGGGGGQQQQVGEACRLARLAYTQDPYDQRALCVYVASLVRLRGKSELFYLGHELVSSAPRSAMSWYTVACYYWVCSCSGGGGSNASSSGIAGGGGGAGGGGKLEQAQRHLIKATKLDKRFHRAWVLLGHVLSAQEESEQALSAYRTAARLLPGDPLPMVCMAKELSRTHYLAPALHLLAGALELCPRDPGVLNELGVAYLKQGSLDLALAHFEQAVQAMDRHSCAGTTAGGAGGAGGDNGDNDDEVGYAVSFSFKQSCGVEVSPLFFFVQSSRSSQAVNESANRVNYYYFSFLFMNALAQIFSNYATALRKCGRYEEALYWYDKCLAASPSDANCHACAGFTFHLMQR